jgi:hypothetical protein
MLVSLEPLETIITSRTIGNEDSEYVFSSMSVNKMAAKTLDQFIKSLCDETVVH